MKTTIVTVTATLIACCSVAGLTACSTPPASGNDAAVIDAEPRIVSFASAGIGVPIESLADDVRATKTIVPWDSEAILEVASDDSQVPGALIVRYGRSGSLGSGDAATIYVLAEAGPRFEPISLQWQRVDGSELTAVAMRDGELIQYDFDR